MVSDSDTASTRTPTPRSLSRGSSESPPRIRSKYYSRSRLGKYCNYYRISEELYNRRWAPCEFKRNDTQTCTQHCSRSNHISNNKNRERRVKNTGSSSSEYSSSDCSCESVVRTKSN